MQIVQIVPGLPPWVDGIGDYALKLARRLRDEQGIQTRFLVGDPAWSGGPEVEGFAASAVTARDRQGFLTALHQIEAGAGGDKLQVLIQFSVYGYEKRGCPFWLVDGLETFAKGRPRDVSVLFHELENHGWKPWSSTFWVSRLQQSLIERVASLASERYTNTELHRRKLEDWGAGRVTLIPNFSTLGEPNACPPFENREPNMIVFGRGAQRKWTYERGGHLLGPLCRRLGVERVLDIGQPIEGNVPDAVDGIPIAQLGRLPAEEVNHHMATSIGTFLQYPVPLLTKSSIHAVSCAFGAIPFVFDGQRKKRSCPSLVSGRDFVPVDGDLTELRLQPLAEMCQRVFDGYQARMSSSAAAVLAQDLRGLRG